MQNSQKAWPRSHSWGVAEAHWPLLFAGGLTPSLCGACSSGPCSELAALGVRTPAGGTSLPLPCSCRAGLPEPGLRAAWASCQCREVAGRRAVSSRKCLCSWAGLQDHNSRDGSWGLSTPPTRPSSSGPGPQACSGGQDLGHAFPCWAWALSSVWLPLCSPPTLLPSTCSWRQRHPFNLLPRRQHGYAGRLSQQHGGRRGGGPFSLVFSCPYLLGILEGGWP